MVALARSLSWYALDACYAVGRRRPSCHFIVETKYISSVLRFGGIEVIDLFMCVFVFVLCCIRGPLKLHIWSLKLLFAKS